MQKSMTLDEDFPRNIQYHFRFDGYSKNYIYTFFFCLFFASVAILLFQRTYCFNWYNSVYNSIFFINLIGCFCVAITTIILH